jgi:hypothetical protein
MINFLILYSKTEGLQSIKVYPDLQSAIDKQFEYERHWAAHRPNDGLVAVALQSESLKNLEKTHGRFFWIKN